MRNPLRYYGYYPGEFPTGPSNTITDVPGVFAGQVTLIEGDGVLIPSKGPVRTGLTLICPNSGKIYLEKVTAAVHTINGYGKVIGFEQVRELGILEAPIALTNTFNVGLVLDTLLDQLILENPELGMNSNAGSVNIVVRETKDGYLNDIQGRHVKAAHVHQAFQMCPSAAVEQGVVGAGTDTMCYGWKGGIGSGNRKISCVLNLFFQAVIETVEEAVINSLTCAMTITGRDSRTAFALPLEPLIDLLTKANVPQRL